MVENLTPKISDVKNLKDLAQVFAIPMAVLAYFFQTGPQVVIHDHVFLQLNSGQTENQLFLLLIIFLVKAAFSGALAVCIYATLGLIHIFLGKTLLYVLAPICFSFALFGLFGLEKYPQLKSIDVFWFYALIVWGFTFLGMGNQFEDSPNKLSPADRATPQRPVKPLGS
jgi:hypothetical protein